MRYKLRDKRKYFVFIIVDIKNDEKNINKLSPRSFVTCDRDKKFIHKNIEVLIFSASLLR